jgi:hypothetical protein
LNSFSDFVLLIRKLAADLAVRPTAHASHTVVISWRWEKSRIAELTTGSAKRVGYTLVHATLKVRIANSAVLRGLLGAIVAEVVVVRAVVVSGTGTSDIADLGFDFSVLRESSQTKEQRQSGD